MTISTSSASRERHFTLPKIFRSSESHSKSPAQSTTSSPRARTVELQGGLSRKEQGQLRHLRKLEKGIAWLQGQGKTSGFVDLDGLSDPVSARTQLLFPDYRPPLGLCTFVRTDRKQELKGKIAALEDKDLGLEKASAQKTERSSSTSASTRRGQSSTRSGSVSASWARISSDKVSGTKTTEDSSTQSASKSLRSTGVPASKKVGSGGQVAHKRRSASESGHTKSGSLASPTEFTSGVNTGERSTRTVRNRAGSSSNASAPR
jgi:hypothetical protein